MRPTQRLFAAGVITSAVAYLPHRAVDDAESGDLARVQAERRELLERNQRLSRELAELSAEVSALHEDPREIERIAREDLNLVRAGEWVYILDRPRP